MNLYIIDDQGNLKVENNIRKWWRWCNDNPQEIIISKNNIDGVHITTFFTGIDYTGHMMLWETIVVGGSLDNMQQRYGRKQIALSGHIAIVEMIRSKGS
jgi:hypothetical protein